MESILIFGFAGIMIVLIFGFARIVRALDLLSGALILGGGMGDPEKAARRRAMAELAMLRVAGKVSEEEFERRKEELNNK